MSYPGNQVTDPPAQRQRRIPGQRGHDPARLTLEDEEHYAFIAAIGGGSGFGAPDADEAGPWDDWQVQPARDADVSFAGGSPGRHATTPPDLADYVPRARSGYAPPAAASPPVPARPPAPARGPLPSGGPAGRSRRGPASGYPPVPGEPGPWYSEPQFSAWNVAVEPHGAGALQLPIPAPTSPGTGRNVSGTAGGRPDGGIALAERADEDLAGLPAGGLAQLSGDGLAELSDDSLEAWAAGLAGGEAPAPADVVAPAVAPPDDIDAHPRREPDEAPLADDASIAAKDAGRTRAAAARARKAARRKGRLRRRVVVAGVCLPVIAAVAAMAYVHHRGAPGNSPAPRAPSGAASVRHPSPSLGRWQHIATRAADPAPLTLGQLFPEQFVVASTSYIRTAQLGSTDCSRAVFGTKLQAAVRRYGCSQVMRASYLGSAQQLMGTIGVLNLSDSAGAARVGKVTGSSQFIAQLTATSGPTHRLAKGTGLEEAEVKGHYLILTWVEFTTLRPPRTAAQRAQLKTFSADLISGTANVSLTSRMVTGQPQVP